MNLTVFRESLGRVLRSRNRQKWHILSGSSPWPVVEHMNTTTDSWRSWDCVCVQWCLILPSQQYQSNFKDPSYPVIAVHREHTHPEVPPPPLPAYPLRHVLRRARLAAVQHQQPTITNCCHGLVHVSFRYGWNGICE